MEKRLIGSSFSKESILQMVNDYFFTKDVVLKDDNTFYNTKLDRVVGYYEVKKNRHRFLQGGF